MSATPTAMYSQNSTQGGSTLATAFPQVTPNGVGSQNLDLFQIASKKGNSLLAVVDYAGTVITGLVLTSVAVGAGNAVYTGTITGGGTNNFVGRKVFIKGFVTSVGNNGEFVITANTTTTITVVATSQVNETHAATAIPYTRGTRIGRFASDFGTADTYTTAALFANTFSNPDQRDIFQAVNIGGNVHYYLNYAGVASGS